MLYIDLDNFKVINDSLGHKYGDKVLIECSNRILNCLRNIDTVARIGGDEFVILIEEMDDYQNSRIAAERIQNAISLPMYLDGNIVYISASIGIRISHIIGESAEDFLRDADIAMYHAKGSGKSCFKEFDISMRDQAMERVQLENELRAALSHHEETQQLFVYYQPIISLEDGIISGFEALTRWRHPLRGFIPPKKFIPVAEESGLICDLGGWVMSEACRQIQAWNCKYQNNPPRSVSVNLSARQFARDNLINDITQILQETGLSPQYLKLEITESVLVDEPERVGRTLEQLRRLGVHLQIDDFGTGYSSLSYLHRLPVDAIKIDQSFVNKLMNPEEGASITEIVRTIISLAWELGITIIAEGVERQEQYTWLRDNECNYAQGYLISEPLDPSAVEVFLENQVEKVSTY